jgi:hypothetical protein
MHATFAASLLALSAALPALAQEQCTPTAFQTKGVKVTKSYDKFAITGAVSNGNSSECGVQLRATSFDSKGDVVDTATFWPASVRNVAVGASEPFKYFLNAGDAKTFEVVPVSAKRWR